jgi:gliding motility-associated-like protein
LTNVAGCDSVIVTITTLQPPDSFLVRKYTCDPALAGLVAVPFKSSLGCDSIVVTQTLYVPPVTTFLKETTCRLDSAGQFTRHLKGWAGCDSVVMIERVFLTADSTVLNTVTCDPLQAGVQVKGLISSTGCDSIVITKVTLLPTPSTYIERESCDPQEAGVKVMQIKTPAGCDSLVIITTVYLRPDTTYQTDSTCNKVNTGRFFRRLSNQKGCDSLIVTDVWLLPNPEGTLSPKLCNGEFIVMNGNRYDLKRRNGREVLSGAAFNGCDSVVNIRLLYSFLDLKISWNGPTCYRGLDGRITIDTIRNGKRPYSIQIDDSRPVPLQFPLVWPGLPAGPHRIYIADAEMCIYEDTLMLPSPPEQIFDLGSTPAKIRLGDSLILKSVRNFEPERVVWQDNSVLSCTTCVEPAAYPLSSVHVEVTAFDSLGCAVSDALNIEVEKSDDIYVATVFSPDKDGENDEIWVSCGPSVAKIRHFAIFDRWGNLVFEQRDVLPNSDATRWNGQLDGRVLPPAVYIYQVEADYIDGRRQVLRGDVTLLR